MKALVIGCGSIGQRHARNLKDLGVGELVVCDPDETRAREFLSQLGTGRYCAKVDDYEHFDLGLVCSPTSEHVSNIVSLVGRCRGVFVEKPLAHSLDGLDNVLSDMKQFGTVSMMAMCYRFNRIVELAKSYLDAGLIGRVYSADVCFGHYLPDWHPGRDYRTEYAARSDLGGGVCLTTGSHVLDLVRYLLGEVVELKGYTSSAGELELDVDTLSAGVLKTVTGTVVTYQFDFLQRPKRSELILNGTKGKIVCNFVAEEVYIYIADQTTKIDVPGAMKGMYVNELRHFIDMVENGKQDATIDVADGAITLRRVLDISLNRLVARCV